MGEFSLGREDETRDRHGDGVAGASASAGLGALCDEDDARPDDGDDGQAGGVVGHRRERLVEDPEEPLQLFGCDGGLDGKRRLLLLLAVPVQEPARERPASCRRARVRQRGTLLRVEEALLAGPERSRRVADEREELGVDIFGSIGTESSPTERARLLWRRVRHGGDNVDRFYPERHNMIATALEWNHRLCASGFVLTASLTGVAGPYLD